ncbi:MAG: class I SAM-dependent methyltransferase [Ignavibacteriaceae bacterium]
MARTEPFDKYLNEYEQWFKENKYVYESELAAVRHFIPESKKGIEIGIGTGRFALPFGIKVGVEPSLVMRRFAANKGLKVYEGIAEKLPLADRSYDFALMVTTICFIDNVEKSFSEVKRILIPGGNFIVGFVDRNSPLGKLYEKMKEQNKFYRYATFYSAVEVKKLLEENEFINIEIVQTVFGELSAIHKLQNFKEGYREGGFVVVSALKKHD